LIIKSQTQRRARAGVIAGRLGTKTQLNLLIKKQGHQMNPIDPTKYQPLLRQQEQTLSSLSDYSRKLENQIPAQRQLIMTNLWQLLTIELGSAFRNHYGDAGDETFFFWCKDLEAFSEEELVRGLEKFKKSGKTYMSLNIFRTHCMEAKLALPKPILIPEGQRMKKPTKSALIKGREVLNKLLGRSEAIE